MRGQPYVLDGEQVDHRDLLADSGGVHAIDPAVGTPCIPAGSAATVEWIAEDLDGGPAQFTVVNDYLVTAEQTTDSTTDLSFPWAISLEGTLIARGASATLEGARSVALGVARGMAPDWAR